MRRRKTMEKTSKEEGEEERKGYEIQLSVV